MRRLILLIMVGLIAGGVVIAQANPLHALHSWVNVVMQALTRDHLPLPYAAPPASAEWRALGGAERLANVRSRLLPKLPEELAARGLKLGQPAFIRIFKESSELELWLKNDKAEWKLFRHYPIACFSGTLGPKTREGDMQAPEGFYSVGKKQLNPTSSYHLSFNIGYPNAYDSTQGRTGSLIMVHGDTCSIGCYAMTDPVIEEIYLVIEAALKSDSSRVPVHAFPFRMNAARMKKAEATGEAQHLDFWRTLQTGHDLFTSSGRVPTITVSNGKYQAR